MEIDEHNKMRGIADNLFEQSRYEDAYCLYDEIYSRVWNAIGVVQNGINDFSCNYLGNSFQSSHKLRTTFTIQIAETVFKKWFGLDVDQTLNELTFTTFGHVQCICYSPFLNKTISADVVYNEFLILQTLVNEADKDDWINQLCKIATPVTEDQRLKRIRPNLTDFKLKKVLTENAEKLKITDWKEVNVCILDYLFNMGIIRPNFIRQFKNSGTYFRQKLTGRKNR